MFSAASLLVLLQLVLGLTQATKTPPKSLQIGVKNKIDPCPVALSKPGDLLSMHYTGYLFNLTPEQAFDSSVTRNQAFEFTLGMLSQPLNYECLMRGSGLLMNMHTYTSKNRSRTSHQRYLPTYT